ncbi:hypothetical protein MLD38_022067 [Melastoma candidum]|uniref:Uncharacterized protein n=1 Tax=Melastoma candidum TaxID=119954 RepID=A0ACB9QI86_9MYRT|nr:hypothetical protein MLD38_022067 [Melastoma candidum]
MFIRSLVVKKPRAKIWRGSGIASEVVKSSDFSLPAFRKLAEYKSKGKEEKRRRLTQESFIGFAMSFLEVGRPGLLRWILQQKEIFPGASWSSKCSFEGVTLEQLIAHDVLLMVCTDPANCLTPEMKIIGNPLKGNPSILLGLVKKLRAIEVSNHKALLLAIVNGKPLLGASYMEEFPYNLEDIASTSWFSIVLVAAEVVSSVSSGLPFAFLEYHSRNPPPFHDEIVQNVLKCVSPISFSRSGPSGGAEIFRWFFWCIGPKLPNISRGFADLGIPQE